MGVCGRLTPFPKCIPARSTIKEISLMLMNILTAAHLPSEWPRSLLRVREQPGQKCLSKSHSEEYAVEHSEEISLGCSVSTILLRALGVI